MSEKTNPAAKGENTDKFKPSNVQDESAGSVTSAGRQERNMEDVSRGSESGTSRKNPR